MPNVVQRLREVSAATQSQKLQIKRAISPSHNTQTPGQTERSLTGQALEYTCFSVSGTDWTGEGESVLMCLPLSAGGELEGEGGGERTRTFTTRIPRRLER